MRSPLRYRVALAIALVTSTTAAAAAEDYVGATTRREEAGEVRSIWWGVRSTLGCVEPGLLPRGWDASVRVGMHQERWEWSADSGIAHPPGVATTSTADRPTDDQGVVEATLVQAINWPWPFAVQVSVPATVARSFDVPQVRTSTSDTGVGDPLVGILCPILGSQRHYQGLVLGLGARISSGVSTDWIHAHGGTTLVGDLRASTPVPVLVDCLAMTASARVEYTRSAEHTLPSSTSTTVTARDLGVTVGAALEYFPLSWCGATVRQEYHRWQFSDISVPRSTTTSSDRLQYAPVMVGAIVMLPNHARYGRVVLDVGGDPYFQRNPKIVGSIGYEVTLW